MGQLLGLLQGPEHWAIHPDILLDSSPWVGQRAASCHTACSPVTCSRAMPWQCSPGRHLAFLCHERGSSGSTQLLPRHPLSQHQPSHLQLSWGMQEELFQERRCSQRWWTGGVTPHLWVGFRDNYFQGIAR